MSLLTKKFTKRTPRQQTYLALGFFALLIVIFYGNTLLNDFAHDDIGQIVQNEFIKSPQYLDKVVTGCIWESALGDCLTYYRPMQSFSYLVTYQITSAPWLFHVVNLLYFFAAVSLVYLVGRKLTRSMLFGLVAAFIFLIHPINNEVVNWISAVPELTFAIFILASTLFYLKYREGAGKSKKTRVKLKVFWKTGKKCISNPLQGKSFASKHKQLFISCGFYFLALLSKEPAVLLPVIFLFLDITFFKTSLKRLLYPQELLRFLPFGAAFIVYMAMRTAVLGGLGAGGGYYGVFTLPERMHAFFTLFGQYILKLLAPYPLLFFYPFEKSTDFTALWFFIGAAVSAVFFAALGYLTYKRHWFYALPLVWVFVFLSPVLISLNAVGENIFSERYLYASSIGFAFLAAAGFVYILKHKRFEVRWAGVALLLVLAGVSWTIIFPRNFVWKNDFALYAKTIEQNPEAHSIRRNYAVELTDAGNYEEALSHLQFIVDSDPNWRDIDKVYNNFGETYARMGDRERALEYFRQFLAISPGPVQAAKAFNNIGAVYFEDGDYLRSLTHFCRARYTNHSAPEPEFNMERVISILDTIEGKNLSLLYDDVQEGGAFQKSTVERVVYEKRSCPNDVCVFRFASSFGPQDIVLPFLIMAKASGGEMVELRNLTFDQQSGAIEIMTPLQFEESSATFIFPTCDGRYYESGTDL